MIYEYLIVGLVPEPHQSQIAELQRQWQFRKQPLPPHITIVPPFRLPKFDGHARILNGTGFSEVHVRLAGVGTFPHHNQNVVCLKVQSPELGALLQRLKNEIPELNQFLQGHITFHVSIARGVPDSELQRVTAELAEKQYQAACTISKLTVYQREIEKPWYEIH